MGKNLVGNSLSYTIEQILLGNISIEDVKVIYAGTCIPGISEGNCKFVEYISTRLPRDQVDYSCDNNIPILRLDLPTTEARERAEQTMLRARKLRTNRIFVKGKIK
jgi:hypothetical protein